MNIFAIAWDMPDMDLARIHAELRRLTSVYPSLDTGTLWKYESRDGLVQAASICNSPESVFPRKYVSQSTHEATFYCGLPVDPENFCTAHDAGDLAAHWDRVTDRLEGTYSMVRLSESPTKVEIQTDLLGGEAVYYLRQGHAWLISNSVLLIERLTNYRALDPVGISMYLSLGHALKDRTLREEIRVMPDAQRWTWLTESETPKMASYYPLASLAKLPRQELSDNYISDLAGQLQKPLKTLAGHFDSLICPLTGGKDSRVIAALLVNAEVAAKYFTYGDPGGDDAKFAENIANKFGLPYEIKRIDEDDVIRTWEEKCLQTVRSTDGMRSLYLLAGMSKSQPISNSGRDIYLWGACGEVARSFYGNLPFLKREISTDDIKEFLNKSGPGDSFGLVKIEAINRAKACRDQCVDECADQGILPVDIPDIYGNHFVDGRRLSNNGRGLAGVRDTYTPYASRAFLEATFSLSALKRYTEPLHFRLIERLAPAMHSMPFAKTGWRLQSPVLNLMHMRTIRKAKHFNRRLQNTLSAIRNPEPLYFYQDSMFHRLNWFESKRSRIREIALDSASASVWDFVNRDRFEQITSVGMEPAIRSQNLQLLFHITTLLYYECDEQRDTR